jgi:hypothetical protein
MSENEAAFFIRWLRHIQGDQLSYWDRAWSSEFLPQSPFWQRNIEDIRSHLKDVYKAAPPPTSTKRSTAALRPKSVKRLRGT